MVTEVLLGLGSNIERDAHLLTALRLLEERFGELSVSPVYESPAVGFDGDPFYNLVVGVSTTDSLTTVNTWLKQVEDEHGRDRSQPKFSSRRLDIDILTWGQAHGVVEGITLPRSEVFRHAFVLKPLVDLRPQMTVPGKSLTWSQLWDAFDATDQPLTPVFLRSR